MIPIRLRAEPNSIKLVLLAIFGMILSSSAVSLFYGEMLLDFGEDPHTGYGQSNTDNMPYLITAVISSHITYPATVYAVLGTLLG